VPLILSQNLSHFKPNSLAKGVGEVSHLSSYKPAKILDISPINHTFSLSFKPISCYEKRAKILLSALIFCLIFSLCIIPTPSGIPSGFSGI
jgi:hypothetical protein